MKRNISLILAIILVICLFAGCGTGSSSSGQAAEVTEEPATGTTSAAEPAESGAEDTSEEPAEVVEESYFPLEETGSLSMWIVQGSIDPEEGVLWKTIQDEFNLDISFMVANQMNAQESYATVMAGGDLPDLFMKIGAMYPGGIAAALDDEVVYQLNDYIDQWMPNYKAVIASNEEYSKNTHLDDGRIGSIYALHKEGYTVPMGLAIRKDWLDDLGMDLPRTYDDYYNVLTAFKTEKGADSAMILEATGVFQGNYMVAGYGVAGSNVAQRGNYPYSVIDGEVVFGPIQEGFRDYLTMMAKWYSEGLIYKDFNTQDMSTPKTLYTNGRTGVYASFLSILGNFDSMMEGGVTAQTWASYDPVLKEGDVNHLRITTDLVEGDGSAWGITTCCEDVELACRFLDWFYSDEGRLHANYGYEGETFHYEGDKPVLEDFVLHNPDGLQTNQSLSLYATNLPIGVIDWERLTPMFGDAQLAADAIWKTADASQVYPANIVLTTDESTEFTTLYNDISTYLNESVLGFIMGEKDLSEFDEFVAKIEDMNIARCTEIRQAAYDRYASK